ncbi:MAG: sulfatase [Dehalococcoidia bacterium]|nr:sulfatase [Dehalococcoidia bacterium]
MRKTGTEKGDMVGIRIFGLALALTLLLGIAVAVPLIGGDPGAGVSGPAVAVESATDLTEPAPQARTDPNVAPTSSSRRANAGPNILFITIDALSAKHIASYGNPGIKTPTMDRLASAGVKFSMQINAFSQTNPSLASIFTSTYPAAHKVRAQGLDRLGDSLPTLASILADYGYETAAIYASKALDPETSGLDHGFRVYRPVYVPVPGQVDPWRLFDGKANITTDAALSWFRERPDTPFFLWVHYQDPHYPYTPPPPFDTMYDECSECDTGGFETIDKIGAGQSLSPRSVAHVTALYEGEVSFADQELGRLLDGMSRARHMDDTIVVLTADEGQSLNDNGVWFHPNILYNTVIRAPLIISRPGSVPQGTEIDSVTRGIDIMPTILEMAGIPTPQHAEGRSLWTLMTGREDGADRVAFTQSLDDLSLAVVTRGWKLIRDNRSGKLELYDLASDPNELNNVAEAVPGKAAELEQMAKAWMESHGVVYR